MRVRQSNFGHDSAARGSREPDRPRVTPVEPVRRCPTPIFAHFGPEGAKIGKNRRGTPANRFNRGNSGPIRFPTAPRRRIMAEIALPHAHGRLRAAATSQHRRLQPGEAKHTMFRQGGAASPANPVSIKGSLDGLAMKDDQGKGMKSRRGCEGFATGPAETGAARKSQAAKVAGERAQR